MKILLFNPNTSESVTERMKKEANKYQKENLQIEVRKATNGPKGIETSYDEVVAAYFTVEELKKIENQYDAIIIGCAADPGLKAARNILNVPVIGLLEASLYTALLNSSRFSILSSCGSEDISAFIELVTQYGFKQHLGSVKYLGVGVNGVTMDNISEIKKKIQECIEEDGSETVILGCAAFAGFGDILTNDLGILVIDGIKASISFAKMMSEWNISKIT